MNIFQNYLEAENKTPDDQDDKQRDLFEYRTLDDKKTISQTKKIDIENEKALNNLIERKMIPAIIEEVGHSIQVNFVDLARRESSYIAAKLGIPEKEMELSKILGEKIEASIQSVVEIVSQFAKDEIYE